MPWSTVSPPRSPNLRRAAPDANTALAGAACVNSAANARRQRDRRIAAHEPAKSRCFADGIESERIEQVRHGLHVARCALHTHHIRLLSRRCRHQ